MRLIILLLLFFSITIHAQEELVTDRPDATESANIMGQGEIQIESGYFYDKITFDDFDEKQIESGVSTLFRIGVFDQAELRIITDYSGFRLDNPTRDEKLYGFSAISLGLKMNIFNDIESGFQLAFLGHLTIPSTGKDEFSPENVAPDFRLAVAKDINERISIGANLGMEWDGDNPEETLLYSAASGIGIAGNLGGFVEIYGFFLNEEQDQHYFNSGMTYLFSPNFQIDFGLGAGLTEASSDLIYTIGASYRINQKREEE